MGKYFTVEVTPTITASRQAANSSVYSAGDILFDWTSFQMPRGAARLIGLTAVMRGKNGAAQTISDLDFYFAKTVDGVAPATIGTLNGSGTAAPIVSNHLIGMTRIDDGAGYGESGLDYFTIAKSGGGANVSESPDICVLEGETDAGSSTLYISCITGTGTDFGTTVLARGGEAAGVLVVETDKGADDDPNADLIFAVGDTLHSATDDVLGKVASIAAFGSSKQDITFAAVTEDVIADNEEIFNINPIRLILSFEK